ncbi:MAG: DUF7601 domain-containing protein [Blautia sp.]|jgi:hypothetical protein
MKRSLKTPARWLALLTAGVMVCSMGATTFAAGVNTFSENSFAAESSQPLQTVTAISGYEAAYSVPWGTPKENLGLPDSLEISLADHTEASDPQAIKAAVVWNGDYDPVSPGDYLFTASFSEETYVYEPMPSVTVTVQTPEESRTTDASLASTEDTAEKEVVENEVMTYNNAEYPLENQWVTVDGIEYEFDLNPEKQTAYLWDMKNPTASVSVNLPSQFTYNETEYTLETMSFSFWKSYPNITALTIPDTVKYINGNFKPFSSVTEITIPGSVSVFEGSFQNCSNLQKIIFSEGVEEIAANTMVANCKALTEISLPTSLKRITQPGAFSEAPKLQTVTLPEGILITEGSTFCDCTSLTSIHLPASITKIPSNTFSGCTQLTSVTADGIITEIGSSAFSECPNLTEIPNLSQVTTIGSSAFKECDQLTGPLDLGNVTAMDAKAFYECYALSGELNLSGLTEIPNDAFPCCDTVTLQLNNQLKSIGSYAFYYITKITAPFGLPETLETIGSFAFANTNFEDTVLTIPDSVTSLGESAFQESNLTKVHIGSGITVLPANLFAGCTSLQEIEIDGSQDEVAIDPTAIPEGVTLTFLIPSIGDVGETIAASANAPTIHEAVAAAPDGIETEIQIKKHVKLETPLLIPAGKKIVLASQDSYIITANQSQNLSNLVTVADGAKLTIKGALTLTGHYITVPLGGGMVLCNGTLCLQDQAVITDASLSQTSSGVVSVTGPNALLLMEGGCVEKAQITDSYSGAIRISGGGHMEMAGGNISGSKTSGDDAINSSAGVLLFENSSLTMSGGEISGNKGLRGSAVLLYSDNTDPAKQAVFTLKEGRIHANQSNRLNSTFKPSGAVHVEGNAIFTMEGGEISDNIVPDGNGGGVCVVDPGLQRGHEEQHTSFQMNGGSIAGNIASTGGGIYSYANGVLLTGGSITDNQAYKLGGGIYSEGNDQYYSTLHLKDAMITDNRAYNQGGGMWYCPTGSGTVYVSDGAAIYGNTAQASTADGRAAGDDFLSAGITSGNTEFPHTATLADRMLGGGTVAWYTDGATYTASPIGVWPSVNPDVPRYRPEEPGSPVSVQELQSIALKAVASQAVIQRAKSKATLLITGNTADKGGGIGANGGVVIGTDSVSSMTITKKWSDEKTHDPVTIHILADGCEIDQVTLSQENYWTQTLSGLPTDLGKITITEDPVSGYTMTYSVTTDADGNYNITVNNKPSAGPAPTPRYGKLSVSKTVAGDMGDKTKAFAFKVSLNNSSINGTYGDMTFADGTAAFFLKHGESLIATGLPADTAYVVTEEEANQDGYTTVSTKDQGIIETGKTAEVIFTNTKDSKPPADRTGSLTVSKLVTGNAGGQSESFHFTVIMDDSSIHGNYGDMTFDKGIASFTLKHGESKTASGLLAGTSYEVTEKEAGENGYSTTAVDDTGTIKENQTAEAVFTNTKNSKPDPGTGNLTISKIVTGTDGNTAKAFTFTVTLNDTSIQGTFGDIPFKKGVATFPLKHGESRTAAGLPAGLRYTVKESGNEGYTVTASGDTGTIVDGKTAISAFKNHKDKAAVPTAVPTKPASPAGTGTYGKTAAKNASTGTTPQTGDTAYPAIWLAVMGIAAAGCCTAIIFSRKQKKAKR